MPTFINPFKGTDPTAQAISELGTAMFGNTGAGEVRKQQIIDLQRKNTETDNFGKMVRELGTAGALATPEGQAYLFSSGYKPSDANDLALGGAANQFGATDARTQNAQVGAGQSYDNTADAVNAKLFETARQFDQKPMPALDATGKPVFTRQGNDLSTLFPVLTDSEQKGTHIGNEWDNMAAGSTNMPSDEQLRIMGAAPKGTTSPHNYVAPDGATHITYDGVTDAQTNQPLPPGGFIANTQGTASETGVTNATKSGLQGSVVQAQQFHGLAQAMIGLTEQHPEAFGVYGKVAGSVQELAQAADTLITQMGGKQQFDQLLGQAQEQLAASGASPDVLAHFNPAIPAVDTLGPILAYSAASAVANQSGRSVSDKEIQMWSTIVGDPQGWLSSAAGVQTRMKLLDATVTYAEQINKQFLDQGVQADPGVVFAQAYSKAINDIANNGTQPLTAPAPAPDANAAPGAAPVVSDEPQEGDTATGPNGEKVVLRGGQWVPA